MDLGVSKCYQVPKIASLQNKILRTTKANKQKKDKIASQNLMLLSPCFRYLHPSKKVFPTSSQFPMMKIWGLLGSSQSSLLINRETFLYIGNECLLILTDIRTTLSFAQSHLLLMTYPGVTKIVQ